MHRGPKSIASGTSLSLAASKIFISVKSIFSDMITSYAIATKVLHIHPPLHRIKFLCTIEYSSRIIACLECTPWQNSPSIDSSTYTTTVYEQLFIVLITYNFASIKGREPKNRNIKTSFCLTKKHIKNCQVELYLKFP